MRLWRPQKPTGPSVVTLWQAGLRGRSGGRARRVSGSRRRVVDLPAHHPEVQPKIAAAVFNLQEMGADYANAPAGARIDTADVQAPYMPPFVGTDAELEALVAYLSSLVQGDDALLRLAGSGGAE